MTSVLFVLPVGGGGGGAHSVMQEADAMWGLGVPAFIASNTANAPRLRSSYRDLARIRHAILAYDSPLELGVLIDNRKFDAVIATTNQSVHVLADALAARVPERAVRVAYYIQDYEPLFYQYKSDDWRTAYTSFNRIPEITCFAKTAWIQDVVEANHGVQVHRVEPSVDHDVYFPDISARFAARRVGGISVAAMVRPITPRRAPRRTCRILNRIKSIFRDRVHCTAFGSTNEELHEHGLRLTGVSNAGVLERRELGELFRRIDLFLDLSDYQAFGRTAIEAMSCGAFCVVPAHGGAREFAEDGLNALVVDTRSEGDVLDAVAAYMDLSDEEKSRLSVAAINAGYKYNSQRAALSELRLLFGLN